MKCVSYCVKTTACRACVTLRVAAGSGSPVVFVREKTPVTLTFVKEEEIFAAVISSVDGMISMRNYNFCAFYRHFRVRIHV